jgi:hypothetical protein
MGQAPIFSIIVTKTNSVDSNYPLSKGNCPHNRGCRGA